jgi:hypothetical protein
MMASVSDNVCAFAGVVTSPDQIVRNKSARTNRGAGLTDLAGSLCDCGDNSYGRWRPAAHRSELAPGGLARVHQLELDRCDPEQADNGRLARIFLDPVVMRRARDAPDESARGDRHRVVGIEVGAAVYLPCAGEHEREAVGRIGVRGAHVARYHFIRTR